MRKQCFVYGLKSERQPHRYYTGLSSDYEVRLADHNAGRCESTARDRPWTVDVVVQFGDEARAAKFERYLKSGSGCAFAIRHLR